MDHHVPTLLPGSCGGPVWSAAHPRASSMPQLALHALASSLGGRMMAHPALTSAASPAWSKPSEEGSTGVDFLGTRAANLEMLTRLTGAYNNGVVSARQHAIV